MLCALGDDVVAFTRRLPGCPPQGDIVRLCCSRGEVDFPGACIQQARHLRPGIFNRLPGRPAIGVRLAGGIAERALQLGEHRLQDPGVDRCGRMVIEVHLFFHNRRAILNPRA